MGFQTLAILPLLFSTALSYRDSLYPRDLNDQGLSLHHRTAIAEAYADGYADGCADAYDSAHAAIRARWLNEPGIYRRCLGSPPHKDKEKENPIVIYEDPETKTTQPTTQDPPDSNPTFEDLEHNARPKENPETETERSPGK